MDPVVARQSGTVNSSLTLRPSARDCAKAQMMWIGGPATAHQARLLNRLPDMIAVTYAQGKNAAFSPVACGDPNCRAQTESAQLDAKEQLHSD